jgi:phosphatidylserine decarboxylase
MAFPASSRACLRRPLRFADAQLFDFAAYTRIRIYPSPCRHFSSTRCRHSKAGGGGPDEKGSFWSKLGPAWHRTKIEWYSIPVGLGVAFLGFRQFGKARAAERERLEQQESIDGEIPRRPRIRPTGPWQVQVMSTLPLKALSRLWGRFNEIELPYSLRVPGFKLYAWIFGVNLDEVGADDLHVYPNLAAFFYRTLKPGVRPLDPNPAALLSPSDGRILQFGVIERWSRSRE